MTQRKKTDAGATAQERLEAILGAAALLDDPTDQPPPDGFQGEPDDWWWRVAVFRYASTVAISTGYHEQFKATSSDPHYASDFKTHIEFYEKEMRRWAFSDLPAAIEEWVADGQAYWDPVFNRRRRFEYILSRQRIIEWWQIRARLDPTPDELESSARQFMMGCLPFLNIAADEDVQDVEFFKAIVKPRTQGRSRESVYEASHFIRCYWMSWSLWNLSHAERAAVINRRSGLPAFEASTIRKAAKKMGFPQEKGGE